MTTRNETNIEITLRLQARRRSRVRRHWNQRPAVRCWHVNEMWGPHPGCREFMARPEVAGCRRPATHVVEGVDYYEGRWRVFVCDEDLAVVLADDPGARAYRFRSI